MQQIPYRRLTSGVRCFGLSCAHNGRLAKEAQCRAFDKTVCKQLPGATGAGIQRIFSLPFRQRADIAGHQSFSKIAVGLQFVRRHAPHGGVARQIDGIGDDGRSRIGL